MKNFRNNALIAIFAILTMVALIQVCASIVAPCNGRCIASVMLNK